MSKIIKELLNNKDSRDAATSSLLALAGTKQNIPWHG